MNKNTLFDASTFIQTQFYSGKKVSKVEEFLSLFCHQILDYLKLIFLQKFSKQLSLLLLIVLL